jgi:CDP-diacylglycerol--glycerol-3-phosphate 3-phosphatidyltransferase
MPSVYDLKPAFQNLLRPAVRAIARAGVTANQVTVAAAIGSAIVGAAIAMAPLSRWPLVLVGPWLFVRMALNAIDGMLAREYGQKSRLGAYLNELTDVASDSALYLPFAFLPPFSPLWTGIVIVLAVLSEFAGILGPAVGASRRYDGPMGKSDRAFVFGALGLWAGLGYVLPEWLAWVMPLLALLIAVTIVNRVRRGLEEGR